MLIKRKSYVRKDGTRVKASSFSIKNRGRPGRGPKLFKLKKGGLTRYGYSTDTPMSVRHKALSMAISRGVSGLTLSRRIGALATLLKRANPKLSQSLRRNQLWLGSHRR
jgi:hypothetical protein